MKKFRDYFIKTDILSLLFLILIFASCNTNKQVSDYPDFKTFDQKKYVLQAKGINTQSRQKYVGQSDVDNIPQNVINEKEIFSLNTKAIQLSELVSKSYLREIIRKPELQISKNNPSSLLASLSFEPLSTAFSFYPDTNKLNNTQTIDSNSKANTQSPAHAVVNDNSSSVRKEKNTTTYAYISLIAALLSIPIIFIFPGLFFLFAIAAIVFGALGLKSSKRKLAIAGMIIGIVTLSLLLLTALIFFLGGPIVLT